MLSTKGITTCYRYGDISYNHILKRLFASKEHKPPELKYLERGQGVKIAYRVYRPKEKSDDNSKPGVIFCPGFQSSMEGVKAMSLEKYCMQKGLHYVRFDYRGCGVSTGDLRKALFSDWKSDVMAVLDQLTSGQQIIVGSSMGAWLMILVAMERPHRIHSLIGVSSAPDFTQRAFSRFSPEVLQVLQDNDGTIIDSEYGNYVITKNFLNDTKQYNILHRKNIPLLCPVRLLHGMNDIYVPHNISVQLAEKISSNDVTVVLRKQGDHRLSKKADIHLLFEELDNLIHGSKVEVSELAKSSHSAFSLDSRTKEEVKDFKGE